MRYIPIGPSALAEPPTSAAVATRRAFHDLRVEAARRAWATRPLHGTPPSPAEPPRVVAPFGAAAPSERLVALLTQLQAVTARYVRGLRADGARPEQMLVAVKGFVRDAMAAEGWHDPDAALALTAEVVRWSIDAYYEG